MNLPTGIPSDQVRCREMVTTRGSQRPTRSLAAKVMVTLLVTEWAAAASQLSCTKSSGRSSDLLPLLPALR